jgi:hypothetical protein
MKPGMTHGRIEHWCKAPGEAFQAGDVLCLVRAWDVIDGATVHIALQPLDRTPGRIGPETLPPKFAKWLNNSTNSELGNSPIELRASTPGVFGRPLIGDVEVEN